MTREEIDQSIKRLSKLTRNMDVLEFRRTSVKWLSRNLAIRNKDHPKFPEASEIVQDLHRAGIS